MNDSILTRAGASPKLSTPRLILRRPRPRDHGAFVEMVHATYDTLRPWVEPPTTPYHFEAWVCRCDGRSNDGFLIFESDSSGPIGVADLNAIVHGVQQTAQLTFYLASSHQGRGLMTEALDQVLRYAYNELGLHRVEANIQPENTRSRALIKRLGFQREGFSPSFLKLGGEWRDHERWALLRAEWSPLES